MASSKAKRAGGKEKLMAAAMELAASTRSLASLGIRELSRHAGLNPNTFYRHFDSFDDLGLAMLGDLGVELRKGLREQRMTPALAPAPNVDDPDTALKYAQSVARESVRLVLEFVQDHRNAYIVGIRELFGSSPKLRAAMNELLDDMARDITEDIFAVLPVDGVSKRDLDEVAQIIVRQMVFFSMDIIEHPERTNEIHRRAERFILLIFWGALSAWLPETVAETQLQFPEI